MQDGWANEWANIGRPAELASQTDYIDLYVTHMDHKEGFRTQAALSENECCYFEMPPLKEITFRFHIHVFPITCVEGQCATYLFIKQTHVGNKAVWQRQNLTRDNKKLIKELLHVNGRMQLRQQDLAAAELS